MAFLRIKKSGKKNYLYRVSTYRDHGKVKQKQEYLHAASKEDEENLQKKNIGAIRCIKFTEQQMHDLINYAWGVYTSTMNMEPSKSPTLPLDDVNILKILAETLWERICTLKKQQEAGAEGSQEYYTMSPNEISRMLTIVSTIGSDEYRDWLTEILEDPLNPEFCEVPWRRRMREVEQ